MQKILSEVETNNLKYHNRANSFLNLPYALTPDHFTSKAIPLLSLQMIYILHRYTPIPSELISTFIPSTHMSTDWIQSPEIKYDYQHLAPSLLHHSRILFSALFLHHFTVGNSGIYHPYIYTILLTCWILTILWRQ